MSNPFRPHRVRLLGICADCCAPDPPDPPPSLSVGSTCYTFRKEAFLCGFSGNRPSGNTQSSLDPTAPWNTGPFWKWKRKYLVGSHGFSLDAGPFRADAYECEKRVESLDGTCSSTTVRSNYASVGGVNPVEGDPDPVVVSCDQAQAQAILALTTSGTGCSEPGFFSSDGHFNVSLTQRTHLEVPNPLNPDVTYCSDIIEILDEPDTIEAAIARLDDADSLPGVGGCVMFFRRDFTTSPGAIGNLSIGEVQRLDIALSATGDPDTCFTITLTYADYLLSEFAALPDFDADDKEFYGEFLGYSTAEITGCLDGDGNWSDYITVGVPELSSIPNGGGGARRLISITWNAS
jgi:hypothetical protein